MPTVYRPIYKWGSLTSRIPTDMAQKRYVLQSRKISHSLKKSFPLKHLSNKQWPLRQISQTTLKGGPMTKTTKGAINHSDTGRRRRKKLGHHFSRQRNKDRLSPPCPMRCIRPPPPFWWLHRLPPLHAQIPGAEKTTSAGKGSCDGLYSNTPPRPFQSFIWAHLSRRWCVGGITRNNSSEEDPINQKKKKKVQNPVGVTVLFHPTLFCLCLILLIDRAWILPVFWSIVLKLFWRLV